MTTLAYTVPTPGTDLNAIADPEMATALTAIKAWANGSIDAVNLSALLAQAAGVNQNAQVVKGVSNIATSQSTSSTTYTTLATPDQVTGIVLPTNGLLRVYYQATWQGPATGTQNAAVFLGANQLQIQGFDGTTHGPLPQAALCSGLTGAQPLFSFFGGLAASSSGSATYGADVTTGQVVGYVNSAGTPMATFGALNANLFNTVANVTVGGPCCIFAAAGTYTVSVQFKTSTGSVTASNRKLWVEAVSYI